MLVLTQLPVLQVGRAMYQRAGELGAPVGHMPFKGLLGHLGDIELLCSEYPATNVIIDHFGFCKCGDLQSQEWQALLGLARFPQVRQRRCRSWSMQVCLLRRQPRHLPPLRLLRH